MEGVIPVRQPLASPSTLNRLELTPLVGLDPASAMRVARAQRPPLPRGMLWYHPPQAAGASAGTLCGLARGTHGTRHQLVIVAHRTMKSNRSTAALNSSSVAPERFASAGA
jgi:hypothetical protein